MKKLKVILIGAGDRGNTYAREMKKLPDQYEIVAVAEPIDCRRERIKEQHHLPEDRCYKDYRELLSLGKIADIAVISTMDRLHFAPVTEAMELGYDLLLEKPIAPTAQECIAITEKAKQCGVKVVLCTVLRYTPLFCKIKEIIDSGKIGQIVSISHEECVGDIHQTHSFVRGNWGNSGRSSAMLLQKSCHDMDLLYWLIGKKCKKIQSFGNLTYFTEKNAPKGAPAFCIEGCPVGETCPYNAVKLYLQCDNMWFRCSATGLTEPTDADVEKAIRETNYGRCVFRCDNDVVDHQVVNMLFEDDITVTFSMNAFNSGGRYINIYGTKGEIRAALKDDAPIRVFHFETQTTEEIASFGSDGILGGHGGGDEGIIRILYEYYTGGYHGKSVPTIEESCYSHLLTFAAEKSRAEQTVVDVEEFIGALDSKT